MPEFIYFTKKEFIDHSDELIKKIRCTFKSPIIIRSATYDEDGTQVNAGKYTSFELRNLSNDNQNFFYFCKKLYNQVSYY